MTPTVPTSTREHDVTSSHRIADRAIALTFDTATTVRHVASDMALAIADAHRLTPLRLWGAVGAAALVVATAVAIARR